MHRFVFVATVIASVVTILVAIPAAAAPVGTNFFFGTWAWTDKPVADGIVNRTWMWGPEAYSDAFLESYEQSPRGVRLVQYYDKARMEITHPGNEESLWYITNGLLVNELVSGKMQLGDDQFEQHAPANINIVGDADQENPITYAMLGELLDAPPQAEGDPVWYRLSLAADGSLVVSQDDDNGSQGITAGHYVTETNHTVATPFWEFMNSSGITYGYSILFDGGSFIESQLFQNPFYATGYPITEAYWVSATVGGTDMDVLVQCFERRCLTYTPSNPAGWQVEAGNVGQHYFRWRYGDDAPPTIDTPDIEIADLWPGETFTKPGPVEEHITLRNNESQSLDLTGWFLWDRQDDFLYEFAGISIAPGATLTIYSCGGEGSGAPGTIDIGHCDEWWGWGDYAQLFDPTGILVDYQYRSSQ